MVSVCLSLWPKHAGHAICSLSLSDSRVPACSRSSLTCQRMQRNDCSNVYMHSFSSVMNPVWLWNLFIWTLNAANRITYLFTCALYAFWTKLTKTANTVLFIWINIVVNVLLFSLSFIYLIIFLQNLCTKNLCILILPLFWICICCIDYYIDIIIIILY